MKRKIADLLCRIVRLALPGRIRMWGDALQSEVDAIGDHHAAMQFAMLAVPGLLWVAFADRFRLPACDDHSVDIKRSLAMFLPGISKSPRRIALWCGVSAALLGLLYLYFANAPISYLLVNVSALILGVLFVAFSARWPLPLAWSRFTPVPMAALLLATALSGSSVDGASRWIAIGPLFVQTSLIVLPYMLLRFARTGDTIAMLSLCAAALAIAMQPDRAMAGVMLTALLALSFHRFDRKTGIALTSASLAFLVTAMRSDTLLAVRYVDQIFYSAFDVHFGAGLAVTIGAALLVIPALAIWWHDAKSKPVALVFGAIWCAMIAAAAAGNYPTPVVGYGGSAILGYLFGLVCVPQSTAGRKSDQSGCNDQPLSQDGEQLKRLQFA